MARMPLEDPHHWRIGHFCHIIPDGYVETLESGTNRIRDPMTARYYEKLAFVVTGDVWDAARLAEIRRLNTGAYDPLLEHLQPAPPP